ncbi:hypothetical protein D3C78_1604960 [compost metagenome]
MRVAVELRRQHLPRRPRHHPPGQRVPWPDVEHQDALAVADEVAPGAAQAHGFFGEVGQRMLEGHPRQQGLSFGVAIEHLDRARHRLGRQAGGSDGEG